MSLKQAPSIREILFYKDFLKDYDINYNEQLWPEYQTWEFMTIDHQYTILLNRSMCWNKKKGWFDENGKTYKNFEAVVEHLGLNE